MGQSQSQLTSDELRDLQRISKFTAKELKRLYKRFKDLDTSSTGTLTRAEFLALPELAMNPLRDRILILLDANSSGSVNFRDFVSVLSVFTARASREEKLRFSFRLYDLDEDGVIRKHELLEVLQTMVGCNLTETQLNSIVDKTFREVDLDGDGEITFEEFSELLKDSDVENRMTIRF
ncbi:hypothetical protein PCE1_000449 [Barthelona sp. PCE]